MKLGGLATFLAMLALAASLACGGGSGPRTPAQQTFQAAQDEAEQTPVDKPVRQYAKQLCAPVRTLLEETAATFQELDQTQTPSATEEDGEGAFATALAAFGSLKEPLQQFQQDLEDINPPNELEAAHQGMIDEIAYTIEGLDAIATGGLFGALGLPTPPPTPEEPPGLEAALIQECGEDLRDVADQFGGSFFGADETPSQPTMEPGAVGETVQRGNFELTVHSVTDPYEVSEDSFAPQSGDRWVLIDVSLTNISSESQDYGPYDFKVRDADNYEYDVSFVDLDQELNSGSLLPNETIRGQIGFDVPAAAQLVRVTYESGFFDSKNRIDISLAP